MSLNFDKMTTFQFFKTKKQLLVFAFFTFLLNAGLLAQQSKVWDYPIHYGTPEWEKLTTFEEMLNAYNIPDSLLKNMTTKDLVATCLKYPNWVLITFGDTYQEGYNIISKLFNGFKELEQRPDAEKELIDIYCKMDPKGITEFDTPVKQGTFCLQFTFIELLISQNKILRTLNKDSKTLVVKTLTINYDIKNGLNNYYSMHSLLPICLALGRIMEIDKPLIYSSLLTSNSNINNIIDKGYVSDKNSFDQIINASKIYLKQLEP